MGHRGRETSLEKRKIILNLHNQNKSYSEIAKIMKKSKFTVQSVIKRYKDKENVASTCRSGRPPKLSARYRRNIVRLMKENPKLTSSEIFAQFKEYDNIEIDPSTIRKFLKGMSYASRVARRKPFISKSNQKRRKEFAYDYQNKDLNFWDHVLWSDGSKFNLFKCDGRVRVWRKPNTEFNVKNIQSTVKHGGGGVLV